MTEAEQLATSQITFESSNMFTQFSTMLCEILSSAIDGATRFLSTPSDEPQSSLGSVLQTVQHSESLKDCDESSTIIVGTGL